MWLWGYSVVKTCIAAALFLCGSWASCFSIITAGEVKEATQAPHEAEEAACVERLEGKDAKNWWRWWLYTTLSWCLSWTFLPSCFYILQGATITNGLFLTRCSIVNCSVNESKLIYLNEVLSFHNKIHFVMHYIPGLFQCILAQCFSAHKLHMKHLSSAVIFTMCCD